MHVLGVPVIVCMEGVVRPCPPVRTGSGPGSALFIMGIDEVSQSQSEDN